MCGRFTPPEGFRGRLNHVKAKARARRKGPFHIGEERGWRPIGSRAQSGEAFIADLYADWLAHGVATIEKVRVAQPADYLKVIAPILLKDVNMNVSPFEHMTDDELKASIERLLADVAEREGSEPTEH